MTTVLGVFENKVDADDAIEDLREEGYNPEDISILAKDTARIKKAGRGGTKIGEGIGTGLATGAVVGGIAGLLVGIGAIAIPGIGGVLIGGPIATALGLTGAAALTAEGALAGGLIGSLIGLGIPEKDARIYEERVKEGAVLLFVPIHEDDEKHISQLLEDYNATNIKAFDLKDNGYYGENAQEPRGQFHHHHHHNV